MRAGFAAMLAAAVTLALPARPTADDGGRVLSVDHYVAVQSEVPVIAGNVARIYVRERVAAGTLARASSFADRVVLFVHGSGTPGEVAFDVPYADYSWMAYLAGRGFDVFAMDFTGYGRSTRPVPMNDPCNLPDAQQADLVPMTMAAPCPASYPHQLTSIASDWHDLDAVVDYIRALRHVERVDLVGWSLGAPRAGGFTLRHPEKVRRLVLLAPAFGAASTGQPPATLPADGVPMSKQTRADFTANWDRQVGCPGQYEPAAHDAVWSEMLAADPVGATWGPGLRRAPAVTTWGWNAETVAGVRAPTLLVTGIHDRQVAPARVHELYDALGSEEKALVDFACSSHNAMWETNHGLLFHATWEWLAQGTVEGQAGGVVRLGDLRRSSTVMNQRLAAFVDELYASGVAHDAAQPGRLLKHRDLEPATADLLGIVVRAAGARRVVEIGTANGGACLAGSADGSADLLFLDAERVEYPGWWPHPVRVLRPGGVLAIDNVLSHADEVAPCWRLIH